MFPMARVGFALLFGLTMLARAQGQPLANAAQPLAARISSLLPRRATVSLDFQVLAPIQPAESSLFRATLSGELQKAGLAVSAATQPEARIRVSLSENARGLLLIAEIWNADSQRVAMLPWGSAIPSEPKPALLLSRQRIWEQTEPILDFMLLNSDSQLLVLGTTNITSFRGSRGNWTSESQASLPLARPLPRDPRGRLELVNGALQIFLPGTTCTGSLAPQLSLSCTGMSEPFPINPRDPVLRVRWTADRNTLESDALHTAFYNAAAGLFATPDAKIVDRANTPVLTAEQWGSDLAAVASPCSPGDFVIAELGPGDARGDQVQVFEVVNGQPAARSEPLPLPGAVTALWPSDAQAALVLRNPTTGNYEASRLALSCAQ